MKWRGCWGKRFDRRSRFCRTRRVSGQTGKAPPATPQSGTIKMGEKPPSCSLGKQLVVNTARSSITDVFSRLQSQRRMAFMPFITAGDPNLDVTVRLLRALAASDADLIEIGFPYSDPIADGPVIQASYTRALDKKITVPAIFAAIRAATQPAAAPLPPLVAMTAYSIIFRRGAARFVEQARDAGFSGLIVPDLPADEARELAAQARQAGLDLIQLIAPTTPPERAARIVGAASGFLYCISVAGTTGVRRELPRALRDQLQWLKTQTSLPLAVGFGVSRPEQVDDLRGLADGVIVGSALVHHIAAITDQQVAVDAAIAGAAKLATEMAAAAHQQPVAT